MRITPIKTAAAILGLISLCCSACTPSAGALPSAEQTLDLKRIPWEGGPDYWKAFAKADAAGWDDPAFFPIAIWYNGISTDDEVRFDKEHGINTYMGMDSSTPYSIFERNGVFWIGGKLNDTFTPSSRNWVGALLDDEVDGRFTPEEGRKHLGQLRSAVPAGLFSYANFTNMVVGNNMKAADAQAFVNEFTDAVSVDMYWYTVPTCDPATYKNTNLVPVSREGCRTASSYGKTLDALRLQDAADGKLQPLWQFIENLNGGPGGGSHVANIAPEQLQGAVMNSIINEARGIIYFNQSLNGPCQAGSALRAAQVSPGFCGAAQMEAMRTVNSQIRELAPVINTQSFEYDFGAGLDTMLKIHDGYAYMFSMIGADSRPGDRTLALPGAIKASSAEVLFENRSINIDSHGKLTDSFPRESTYHIYKVKL